MKNQETIENRIDVKQREWAVALDKNGSKLYSEYYSTCVAFAAVDKVNGVACLAHFDSPLSVRALDDILKDLKLHSGNLDHFELYTAASINPFVWLFLAIPFTVIAIFSSSPAWVSSSLTALLLLIPLFFAFSSTRSTLILRLAKAGFKNPPTNLGFYFGRRYRVTIHPNANHPTAASYWGDGDKANFEHVISICAPRKWFTVATKSKKSD